MLTPLGVGWTTLIERAFTKVSLDSEAQIPDPCLPAAWRPTPDSIQPLRSWLDLIAHWNGRLDLTAARGEEELVDLAIADAILLAKAAAPGTRWVDVGSGAGAPGLALGLMRRDISVTLVEPLDKRVAFLRTAVGSTGARHVRVHRGRGEQLASQGVSFDAASSRATLAPAAWLSLGSHLVGSAGQVWVLLAREDPPELAGWHAIEDRRYQWPLTGAARRLVRFARLSPSCLV